MATAAGQPKEITLDGGPLDGVTVLYYVGQPAISVRLDTGKVVTYVHNPLTGTYEWDGE